MLGFKRSKEETDNTSWNIGIGAIVDPNSKVLGDDVEANKAPPNGETDVRLKETSQWGVVIISSFSF